MDRTTCWEYIKCGREQNCPAYPSHGRACYAVTATHCRGEVQKDYEEKIAKCRAICDFYKFMFGLS